MNKIFLSIVVICYNNERYIKECLNSIISQLNKNIELIIVNDGSTDNSLKIIKNEVSKIDNTKVITIKNSGISIARNKGISEAKGSYLMLIDGDDYICNQSISKIIDYLLENKSDLLLLNTTKYFEKAKLYEKEILEINHTGKITYEDLINNKIGGRAWRFVYNLQNLRNNNIVFSDNLIYEDEEWVPKAVYHSNSIAYIDIPFYFYRKTDNTITSSRDLTKILNLIEITNKTMDWFVELNEKNKYIEFSLSRCIRNILSYMKNASCEQKKEILKWYYIRRKDIFKILRSNKKMKFSFIIFGPTLGLKIYKKIFREKYKLKKCISSNII